MGRIHRDRDEAVAAFNDATRLRSEIQQARIKAEDERDAAIARAKEVIDERDDLAVQRNTANARAADLSILLTQANAEIEQLRKEKELVQQWLRNMPDANDLEDAKKKAEEIADRIAELDSATQSSEAITEATEALETELLAMTPQLSDPSAEEIECCDECGHLPSKGNVVYEDSGRRPLCKSCNSIRKPSEPNAKRNKE